MISTIFGITYVPWLLDVSHTDPVIAEKLASGAAERDDVIATILTSSILRGLAFFDFALITGDNEQHRQSVEILKSSQLLAAHAGAVPLWWIARISRNLVDDLWASSLHVNLPPDPPPGGELYPDLRHLFLASLYCRKTSEIELWPSQIDAARRVADLSDDLVVSLPTSAGKTRIAELSTLMTLSIGRRVLIVTPLRALSAQTERSFRRTFGPLGFRVSSLYGSSGTSPSDSYTLHSHDIVIATPEKADFALRSDSSILNDIGLIVLDEGHLIGPNDREIRYEVLVQRLLRRSDAHSRRIVCLSAILPDGDQLDDLSSWIRSDAEGEPVSALGVRPGNASAF